MNDRELLELAAKAAGYEFDSCAPFEIAQEHKGGTNWIEWNPLTDDGDALRLAMKLGFTVESGRCWHSPYGPAFGEDGSVGEMTATRRAIVRAAAAIGEAMQ